MHTHLAMARFTVGDSLGAEAQLRLTAEVTASLPFPQGAWSQAYADWLTAWMQIEQGRYADALTTSDALVGRARHGFDNWSMLAIDQPGRRARGDRVRSTRHRGGGDGATPAPSPGSSACGRRWSW